MTKRWSTRIRIDQLSCWSYVARFLCRVCMALQSFICLAAALTGEWAMLFAHVPFIFLSAALLVFINSGQEQLRRQEAELNQLSKKFNGRPLTPSSKSP